MQIPPITNEVIEHNYQNIVILSWYLFSCSIKLIYLNNNTLQEAKCVLLCIGTITPWLSSPSLRFHNLFVVRDLGNCWQTRDSKLFLPCHHVAILKPLFLWEGHLSLPVTVYSSGNSCLFPYALCLPFIYLFYCVCLMASLYKLSYSLLHVCSSSAWQLSAWPGRCLSLEENVSLCWQLFSLGQSSLHISLRYGYVWENDFKVCLMVRMMPWWMFVNDQVHFS